MAKTTQRQRDAELVEKNMKRIIEALTPYAEENEIDIIRTGSNSIAIPVLDEEQYERYVEITVQLPAGDRDGEPYDFRWEAEDYARRIEQKKQILLEKRKLRKS